MQKAIIAAKTISKDLYADSTEVLQEYNLHHIFEPILNLDMPVNVANTIICAIIYSYDANSNWCDLKKTSYEDKMNILKGLKADIQNPYYNQFINIENEAINSAIGDFLDLQADWRFAQVMRSRDFHSKSVKEQEPQFNATDDDKVIKAKEAFGKYLREGLTHRKIAEDYLLQIEKDYVMLNHRTEQDFGVKFTDNELKYDKTLWRNFIKYELPKLKNKAAD